MNHNRNKTHELVIDINPRNREKIMSNTTFFSMDVGTSEKIIRFTRNHQSFDLTDATVLVGFHFVDKLASKIIDSEEGSVAIVDPMGGKCRIDIPSHVYDYEGDVMVHLYLKFDNGQSLDCGIIATRFERSWLDKELPEMEKVYIKRFEDLAREIRERTNQLHQLLDGVDGEIVSRDVFNHHVNDRNNPHEVTIEQIGAAPVNHMHAIIEVTGLQNELNNRITNSSLKVAQVGIAGIHFRLGDLLIQGGTVTVPGGSGSHTEVPVVFPMAFTAVPNIQVSTSSTVVGTTLLGVSASNQSATGFNARVLRTGTTGTAVRWLAIGLVAGAAVG